MTPRPHTEEPAARVVDDRATVLIVDADRVSERAIERALAPSGYAIEWARDGGSALDIMRATKVDVTVSDSVLSDMSGALLLTRAAELCGPGAPAFVFVSVDRAIPARVALLAAGAVDYLLKPFAADELRARVSNAIAARLAARALSTRGITGLAGDGAQIPIADLLTMLEFARKSGALQIAIGPTVGWLIVDRGRVVHAEVGTLAGQEAFFALLRYGAGLFRFEPGAIDLQPGATRLLEPRPRRASRLWAGLESLGRLRGL